MGTEMCPRLSRRHKWGDWEQCISGARQQLRVGGPTDLQVEDVAGTDLRLHHVPACSAGEPRIIHQRETCPYMWHRWCARHWRKYILFYAAHASLTSGVHDALWLAGRPRRVPGQQTGEKKSTQAGSGNTLGNHKRCDQTAILLQCLHSPMLSCSRAGGPLRIDNGS